MKMRPFSRSDWYAFNGAEAWKTTPGPDHEPIAATDEPLIAEAQFEDGAGYTLIIDRAGALLVCEDEGAQYGGYVLVREFKTVADALSFAESLGEPRTKDDFFKVGFDIA